MAEAAGSGLPAALVERLRPVRLRLGAHQAFLLDDAEWVHLVAEGSVDVFAVVTDPAGRALTRNPFVARVPAGGLLPGTLALPCAGLDEDRAMAFLAVPDHDTLLLRASREAFTRAEDLDLDVVTLIDEWVDRAGGLLAREAGARPREATLLEADPDVGYGAGTVLGAHSREVLWVHADTVLHFAGDRTLEVSPGLAVPLTGEIWVTAASDARVSAVHTPAMLLSGGLWAALDRAHLALLRVAEAGLAAGTARRLERRDARARQRGAVRHYVLRALEGLLAPHRPAPVPALPAAPDSDLHAAVAHVAAHLGVAFRPPPLGAERPDPMTEIERVSGPSGLRVRRVTLEPGWHRREGPPLVATCRPAEAPPRAVALLPAGRGRWRLADPESADPRPLRDDDLPLVAPDAVMLYPPLPAEVRDGRAALAWVVRGCGSDASVVAATTIIVALFALATPLLTGQLLGVIIPRVDVPVWIAALAGILTGALVSAALTFVGALALLRIEARLDAQLQSAVWSRLLALPPSFFRRWLAGDLADRASGITAVRQVLTGALGGALSSAVTAFATACLLAWYSVTLALWAAGVVVVLALASALLARVQVDHYRVALGHQGVLDALVVQLVLGIGKLRQAGAEAPALARWAERYGAQRRAQLAGARWGAVQSAFHAGFVPSVQLLVLAVIWYALIGADPPTALPLESYLSFNAAYGQMLGAATALAAASAGLALVGPLLDRLDPILAADPEPSGPGAVVLADLRGRIECEGVSFRWEGAVRDTVSDLTFHIRPGEYVAFVGASGSGKSTLYRLLLGFERPRTGTILFDGHDLLTLDPVALRRHLGVVLQHGQLAPDTIYRNIAGDTGATMLNAWAAARAAGLDTDIRAMPMGMQTVLSESATALSGGQRQRLLIARAFARCPRVLLFDEATSMLDNRSQAVVRASLRAMTGTRILVAHRLSTVQDVDRIYVMDRGRIVEEGTFEVLMARDGALAALAARQQLGD